MIFFNCTRHYFPFDRVVLLLGAGMWSIVQFFASVDVDNSNSAASPEVAPSAPASTSSVPHFHKLQQILLGFASDFPELQLRRYLSFRAIVDSAPSYNKLKPDPPVETLLTSEHSPFYFFTYATRVLHHLTTRSSQSTSTINGDTGLNYYHIDVVVQLLDLLVAPETLQVEEALRGREASDRTPLPRVDESLRALLERLRKTQSAIRDRINDLDATRVKNHLMLIIQRWQGAVMENCDREESREGIYDLFGVI